MVGASRRTSQDEKRKVRHLAFAISRANAAFSFAQFPPHRQAMAQQKQTSALCFNDKNTEPGPY